MQIFYHSLKQKNQISYNDMTQNFRLQNQLNVSYLVESSNFRFLKTSFKLAIFYKQAEIKKCLLRLVLFQSTHYNLIYDLTHLKWRNWKCIFDM